jgi:hypothetical protein
MNIYDHMFILSSIYCLSFQTILCLWQSLGSPSMIRLELEIKRYAGYRR